MSMYTRWKERRAHSRIKRDKPLEVLSHRLPFKGKYDGDVDDKKRCACHLMWMTPGETVYFWPYRKFGGQLGFHYLHEGTIQERIAE